MRVVLGIDAAWTAANPSGVALLVETDARWRLIAAEPSYAHFLARAAGEPEPPRLAGSLPHAATLLRAATALAGRPVDLVVIDMPLSRAPITGRRASDDAVSRAYGGRKCGTHTPSATRPGAISDALTAGFAQCCYPLRTVAIDTPGIIEVYPHPALVELARAPERLPYKASKRRTYWPSLSPAERRARLHGQWRDIVALLEREIDGVAQAMGDIDPGATGAAEKAYEDRLDAVVCAWTGSLSLDGRATPFGDQQSAIWIPAPGWHTAARVATPAP